MKEMTLSGENGRGIALSGVLAEFVELITRELDCLPQVTGDGRIKFTLHKNHPLAHGQQIDLATITPAEPPGQTRIEIFIPSALARFTLIGGR